MPYALTGYDRLYAVSDIHLGGTRAPGFDFQIFNRGARLAGFIDQVRDDGGVDKAAIDVALVLNGDLIDSLAEDGVSGYVALDESTALSMLDRLWTDPSFALVWDALGAFVRTPRRHLIVVVGNHDIELALPIVQAELRQRLAAADAEARARIVFATDGAGFACRVGRARVFCSHGNEVDPMNCVDYNQLGQLGNAINAGRSADPGKWSPNGGTRLVRDVMNIIKRRYPFVDLLKPETAAIAGVLAAIDHDTFSRLDLRNAFPIVGAALRGSRATGELLGADTAPGPAQLADTVYREVLGPSLREALAPSRAASPSEDELLLRAGQEVAAGVRALTPPDTDAAPQTLGLGDLLAGMLRLLPKEEALRRALQDWMTGDRTYDVASPTQDGGLFEAMNGRVAPTIDFTITGHSHLARALRFDGGGYYYNCGTWIRLLRLTPQVLDSPSAFKTDVWPALTAGSMQALDAARIPGPGGNLVSLLLDRTNAVRIVRDGAVVKGDLLRIDGDRRDQVALTIEGGTTTAVVR